MYAIVDIETTGGHASANRITEVAIILHDGEKVVEEYQSLVNPGIEIPLYISALTGINNEMVKHAPAFEEIAADIFRLLQDKVFVAHNVNFDYSFLKHHLSRSGYDLQCKKLCTVRLGRKVFPGLASYSLGKLCRHLSIEIENRHRAGGDAAATAQLFSLLLRNDNTGHIVQALKRDSKEQQLPPNLARDYVERLPQRPGVYYFKDQKGKVIYVGKAVNLQKRVRSHFTGNSFGRQRQEFLKNIHSVEYTECGTELIALILESIEIKRLWPANNRAMKRFEPTYGLYLYEDQRGFMRLMIDKKSKYSSPLFSFSRLLEGRQILSELVKKFELCPKMCYLQTGAGPCLGEEFACKGACRGLEGTAEYNARLLSAVDVLKGSFPSFMLVDEGRSEDERSVILVEEGKMSGIAYVPGDTISDVNFVRTLLNPYPCNDYIRNLILDHAARKPEKVLSFAG